MQFSLHTLGVRAAFAGDPFGDGKDRPGRPSGSISGLASFAGSPPMLFGPDPPAAARLCSRRGMRQPHQTKVLHLGPISESEIPIAFTGTRRQKCFGDIWAAECERFGR